MALVFNRSALAQHIQADLEPASKVAASAAKNMERAKGRQAIKIELMWIPLSCPKAMVCCYTAETYLGPYLDQLCILVHD